MKFSIHIYLNQFSDKFSHSFSTELIKINIGLLFLNNIEPNGYEKKTSTKLMLLMITRTWFSCQQNWFMVNCCISWPIERRRKKNIWKKSPKFRLFRFEKLKCSNVIRARDWRRTKTPDNFGLIYAEKLKKLSYLPRYSNRYGAD